jgi:hypothetical protein
MPVDNNPTLCNQVIYESPRGNINICSSITYGFWAPGLKHAAKIAEYNKATRGINGFATALALVGNVYGLFMKYQQWKNDDKLSYVRGLVMKERKEINDQVFDENTVFTEFEGGNCYAVVAQVAYSNIVTKACLKKAFHETVEMLNEMDKTIKIVMDSIVVENGEPVNSRDTGKPIRLFSWGGAFGFEVGLTSIGMALGFVTWVMSLTLDDDEMGLTYFNKDKAPQCKYLNHDPQLGLFACNKNVPVSPGDGPITCYVGLGTTAQLSIWRTNSPAEIGISGGVLRMDKGGDYITYKNYAHVSVLVGSGLSFLAAKRAVYNASTAKKLLCESEDACCGAIVDSNWSAYTITRTKNDALSREDNYDLLVKAVYNAASVLSDTERYAPTACAGGSPGYWGRCEFKLSTITDGNKGGAMGQCPVLTGARVQDGMATVFSAPAPVASSCLTLSTQLQRLDIFCEEGAAELMDFRGTVVGLLAAFGAQSVKVALPDGYMGTIGEFCYSNINAGDLQ